MGFWKASLTALLVVIVFSFASTVLTTKTHAQEVGLGALKKASASKTCIQDSFLLASKPCKNPVSKKEKNAEFLPTAALIPEIELKEKEKVKEAPIAASTPVSASFSADTTATLSAETLFALVNAHRASIALPAFEKEAQVCSVAEARKESMAQEIYQGLPMHAGFWAMNLPYWATENMIYMRNETEALNWWLNSPIHRSAIEGNYKYACGVCNGEVCNMVFTNYEPKVLVAAPTVVPSVPPQPAITRTDAKNTAGLVLSKALSSQ